MTHRTSSAFLLLGALLLQGCGGSEQEYAGIDRGGEKPISVTGPINGFGSVIVNGVHYDTDNAAIFVRGEPADEQELDVGDYVTVVGYINKEGAGIADEVHYQPKVTGEIEHVDQSRNRITVLGQTVQLVQDTQFGSSILPRNIEGLQLGNRISVSGIAGSDNVVRASRIEREDWAMAEVAGMVTALDETTLTFYLNELRVEYAFATPQPVLVEGQPVVVRGIINGQTFSAQDISFDTDHRQLRGIPSLEIRGFVAKHEGDRFHIEGVPAQLMASTAYSNGAATDLADDVQVRARGHFDKNDVLQVEYLRFVSTPVMQAYGIIEEKSEGEITVSGIRYQVRAETSLVGNLEQRISFDDLLPGDAVYMSAFGEGEQLVAASIAVDNRDTYTMSFQFEGPAYGIDADTNQFFVFNRLIQTSAETLFSELATTLTQEQFYQTIGRSDKTVRVRGYLEGGVLIATRAQVSDNNFLNGYHLSKYTNWDCKDQQDCDTYFWPHRH